MSFLLCGNTAVIPITYLLEGFFPNFFRYLSQRPRVAKPTSTAVSSMKKQTSPSVTMETKEKVAKESISKDETSKDYISKPEISKEKASKEEMLEEGKPKAETSGEENLTPAVSAPEDEPHHETGLREMEPNKTPKEESLPKEVLFPSPSEPSRSQKRAAKKKQLKAAKKADKEAEKAKADARRSVQQAVMTR